MSLPNLIAGRQIIPEMLVHLCTPQLVAAQLQPLLADTPQRLAQLDGYTLMKSVLGTSDCFQTTAKAIINDISTCTLSL